MEYIMTAKEAVMESVKSRKPYIDDLRGKVSRALDVSSKTGRFECHLYSTCLNCAKSVLEELKEKGYNADVYEDAENHRYLIKIFWNEVSPVSGSVLTPRSREAAEISRQTALLLSQTS
jgi:hypothetical protein